MPFDVSAIRRQFPILKERMDSSPLVYLDTAATAQKPAVVLDAMRTYYERDNGNPHRGLHPLASRSTVALEGARERVARFLNARPHEIVFTKGATESLNIVAWGMRSLMEPGDAVALSVLEHHSNLVPWLQLKEERGIELRWMEVDAQGRLDLASLDRILADGKVKIVAVTALSNVFGVRPPVRDIAERAHRAGARVVVDAAQAIGHVRVDVAEMACDALAFSGHKLYGPMGIGVLYGKEDFLTALPPLLGGGMMIRSVAKDHFVPADIPARFEGGTPPVAEAVGLRAAMDWLAQYAWKDIAAHEQSLLTLAHRELAAIPGMKILGPAADEERFGCMSFTVDGIHSHDLAHLLGERGMCVRAGHHCAEPLHKELRLIASTRLSVGIYNTDEEIRAVAPAIRSILQRFNP